MIFIRFILFGIRCEYKPLAGYSTFHCESSYAILDENNVCNCDITLTWQASLYQIITGWIMTSIHRNKMSMSHFLAIWMPRQTLYRIFLSSYARKIHMTSPYRSFHDFFYCLINSIKHIPSQGNKANIRCFDQYKLIYIHDIRLLLLSRRWRIHHSLINIQTKARISVPFARKYSLRRSHCILENKHWFVKTDQ